jgi:gliding motility-associated-like protein
MVSIGDDQFINLGESVTLTMQPSINPAEIIWTGPDGRTWENVSELTITPTENGRYTIIISDVNMCRSSDTTYVYVNGQGEAYLPNVFSPNADGQNDVYTIYAGGDVEQVVEMKIFDRWGGMKFVYYNFPPNDPAFGWDGKFKGKELDPGVFVVRAMVRFKDGTEKLFMSDLTLLR